MRKERVPARRLPDEIGAERGRVDRDQSQVVAAGEPFCRGLGRLFGGGEMDEAVRLVDG